MADRGDRCNRRPGRRATGRDPNGWTPPDNSRTPSPLGVPLSPDNEDLAQMLAAQPRNRQPSRSPSPSPQASHLCPARSQSPRRATPPGDWTPPAVQFQPGSPLAYGLLPSPENARDYGQRPPSRSPPRPDFGQCGPPRTTPPPAFQQSPAGQCNADYFNLSGPGWEPPRWDSPLEDSTPSPSPTAQRQTRRRIAFTSSPAGTCAPPTSQDPDGPLAWALPSSPENAGDCGRRPPSRSSPRPDFGQCGPPQPPAFQQSPAGQCNADYFNLSGPGWEPPRWDSPLEDSTPTPSPRTRRSTSPSVHPNARRRLSFTPSPAGTCPPPTSQDPDSPLARPLPSSPENAAGDYVPRPGPSRGGHHGGCRPPGTPRGYPHHSRSPSPEAQRIDPRMVLGAEFFAGEAPELIASGSQDLLDDSWELPGWAAGGSSCEASPDYGFGAANPLAASSPCTEPQTRRSTSPSPRRSHPSSPDDSDCVFIPPSPPPFVDLCSPTSAQDYGEADPLAPLPIEFDADYFDYSATSSLPPQQGPCTEPQTRRQRSPSPRRSPPSPANSDCVFIPPRTPPLVDLCSPTSGQCTEPQSRRQTSPSPRRSPPSPANSDCVFIPPRTPPFVDLCSPTSAQDYGEADPLVAPIPIEFGADYFDYSATSSLPPQQGPCTEPQTRRQRSPSPRRSPPSPANSDCVFIPPRTPPFVDLCSPTSAQDYGEADPLAPLPIEFDADYFDYSATSSLPPQQGPCTEPQTRQQRSPSPRRSPPSPANSDCVFIPPRTPPFVDLCSPTSAQDPGSPLARALPSSPENEAGDYDPRPGPSRGGHPGGCRPPRTPRGYPHHSRSPSPQGDYVPIPGPSRGVPGHHGPRGWFRPPPTPRGYPHHSRSPSPQGDYVPIPGPSRGVPGHHGPRGWFRPPPTPRGYPNDSLSPSPQAAGGNVPRPGPSRGGHHGGCRPPRTPRGYPYDSRSPSPQGPVPAPPVRRGRRSPREMVGDWPQDLEMWPNESPRIDPRMVLGAEFFADEAPELIGSGSRDLLDDSWELPGWAAGDSTCEDYGFGAANPLAASSPNDSPFRAPVRRRLNFSGSPAAAGMPSPGSFGAHHSGNLPSPGDGHGGEWNPASGIYDPAYYSGNLLSPGAGYSAEWSPGSGFEQAYHSDSLLSPGDDLWSSAEWSLGSGGFEPAHLSGSPLAVPLGPGDGYGAEWSLGSAGFEPAYHSGSLLSPGDVFWPSAEWSPGSGGFEQTFQDSYEDFHPQACSTPMPPDYDDFY